MIKTIIFDFGNVFINLDIESAIKKTFETLQIDSFSDEVIAQNKLYEQGLISTEDFLTFYRNNYSNLTNKELVDLWNTILKDFPEYRLDFLKELKSKSKYKLILLSNTNDLHINYIKKDVPFYNDFKNLFDKFYLSYEIHLTKPNSDIFEFVLKENNLEPNECLFIDDNEDNIKTANLLNFKTWHINPATDDVSDLFKTKNNLF